MAKRVPVMEKNRFNNLSTDTEISEILKWYSFVPH